MATIRRLTLLSLTLVLLLLAGCAGEDDPDDGVEEAQQPEPEEAQPEPGEPEAEAEPQPETAAEGLDAVCAEGEQEGSFTIWATIEPENFERLYAAFSDTYPGIEVEFLSTRAEEAVQRIISSDAVGDPIEPDIVTGNAFVLQPLTDRDLIDTDVDWVALGVSEGLIHESNIVRNARVAIGWAYNTNATSPDDLPDTWEDLIDDQYAREAIVDPRGQPIDSLALVWGEEDTVDYAQRLVDVVDPVIIQGGTAGMVAVLSEEAMFTIGGRADSNLELQADGAPIDIKYPDLIPTDDNYEALIANAQNPNAAKCWMGWIQTPEGMQVWEEVEFKVNDDVPPDAPEGAAVVPVETEEDAAFVAEMSALVGEILQ